MVRNKLRNLRVFFGELSPLERNAYAILFVILPFLLISLVNFAPLYGWIKITATTAIVMIALGFLAIVYSSSKQQNSDSFDEYGKDHTGSAQAAPPKPERLPTVGAISAYLDGQESDEDINRKLLTVLESIDRSNKLAEHRRERDEEESRRQQERLNELLNSKTVHYSEIPGFIYFVKRGLWQIIIAWPAFYFVLITTLYITGEVVEWGELLFLTILFTTCSWISARAIFDWRWTQRRVVGIRLVIKQPKNALLLMFGGDYEISLFDCGNAVVKKAKYERFLRLRTATVSVDTPRKNTDNDKDNGDVFNAMENMRRPYEFRDIVMDLHEKLTMSQSNVIKRSGQ